MNQIPLNQPPAVKTVATQMQCSHCQTSVPATSYYCPQCGKKLHDRPVSTSVGRQLLIYVVSVCLPPFGLRPGIKYLLQPEPKAKAIGSVAIGLTFLSIIINFLVVYKFFMGYSRLLRQSLDPTASQELNLNESLQEYQKTVDVYKELGL